MFSNSKTRLGAALAVIALATTAIALAVGIGEDVVSPAQSHTVRTEPLDPYPGFGASPAASDRDDTIAAWEAFREQRHIRSCMRRAGFEYVIEVSGPVDKDLQNHLKVADKPAPAESPGVANDRIAADLPAERRDSYYRALYAQSAATVERGDGHTGFEPGGCYRAAELAVGSIWSTKRQLESQLDAVGRAASRDAAGPYSACTQREAGFAARNPGDIEELFTDRDDLPALEKRRLSATLTTCLPVWARARRKAEQKRMPAFVSEHSVVLEAAKKRYAGAMQAIRKDSEFLEYVAVHG